MGENITSYFTNNDIDYQENNSYTKLESVTFFAKRTVSIIAVAIGALLFPVVGLALEAEEFCSNSEQGLDLSTRIRQVLAATMFPIPLIGPLLFCALSDDKTPELMLLSVVFGEDDETSNCVIDYVVLSIPFVSSAFASYYLICT